MKADRLIKILLLLQHGEKVSTRALSEELEVSERTIHRDMESLSAAGIPVYAERGAAGGWKLVDNWKQRLSWLKEKEVMALFLPHADKVMKDLDMGISSSEIRDKLLLSVPGETKESAGKLWERIHVDMGTWKSSTSETLPAMDVIKEAVMNDTKVKVTYEKANGDVKESIIKPLGLVAKSSTWYVVLLNEADQFRSYRMDRIKACSSLEEPFERPEDFTLAEYWEASKKKFTKSLPEYAVRIVASPIALQRIQFTGRFVRTTYQGEEREDGWTELELSFNSEEEALGFIVGFGDQVKVCSPVSLQDKVRERAEEIIELYK
ncbi:helix-turn-helix transcriptional regulator [Halobacillus salinus]|nr:YafY family protein [Halobacillus salinus]